MSERCGRSNVDGRGSRNPDEPFGPYYCGGIPDLCWCGEEVLMLTSKSDENPYQRFFRCERAAADQLVNDNHAFKWIDEAYYDELKLIQKRIRKVEEDMNQKFMDVKEDILDVKEDILDVKEELKAELLAMKIASDIRNQEDVTTIEGVINHFSEEVQVMSRKWKKMMMFVCGIFVITASIMKAM